MRIWGWAGSIMEYNKRSGYLQDQREFQENDRLFKEGDDFGKVVMWLILYD